MIKTLWAVEVETSKGFIPCTEYATLYNFESMWILHVYKSKKEAMNLRKTLASKSRVVKFVRDAQK